MFDLRHKNSKILKNGIVIIIYRAYLNETVKVMDINMDENAKESRKNFLACLPEFTGEWYI